MCIFLLFIFNNFLIEWFDYYSHHVKLNSFYQSRHIVFFFLSEPKSESSVFSLKKWISSIHIWSLLPERDAAVIGHLQTPDNQHFSFTVTQHNFTMFLLDSFGHFWCELFSTVFVDQWFLWLYFKRRDGSGMVRFEGEGSTCKPPKQRTEKTRIKYMQRDLSQTFLRL